MRNIKNIANITVFCLVVFGLAFAVILLPDTEISKSERRLLYKYEQLWDKLVPEEKEISFSSYVEAVDPVQEIESYFLDQFPLRDKFREIKAFVYLDLFKKNDNNKIYKYEDTIIKIEDTLDEKQVGLTVNLMNSVIDRVFPNNKVHYSIVPDKHYIASKENGYPAMDYDKMLSILKENVKAEYIDITGDLELSDYYTTDSHWSQDKITDVAQRLVDSMGNEINLTPENGWKKNELSPFYGVYYGQSALNVAPDKIVYLTSDNTENMTMTAMDDLGKTKKHPVYTLSMFENVDPYDVFTAGASPFVVIENPNAKSDKELFLIRDSFGSSIAPLFAEGYSKVTMIDLRYLTPDLLVPNAFGVSILGEIPEDADVLFLYSTGLVNGGGTLKNFMTSK